MGPPSYNSEPPEANLAALIRRELGISIDKAALRIFIRANWSTVQSLAHAIHGTRCGGPRPSARHPYEA